MSDPCGELRAALEPWLRGYADVVFAFAACSLPVKVYGTLPPVNVAPDYLVIAGLSSEDDEADCFDGAEVDVQIDAWSLTDPPGFGNAEKLAPAARAALKATVWDGPSGFVMPSYRVKAVQAARIDYLTDPSDGKTVHAVIRARLSIDPVD